MSSQRKYSDDADKMECCAVFILKKKPSRSKGKVHTLDKVCNEVTGVLVYITFSMFRTNTSFLSAVNKDLHISILSRDRGVGIYVSGTIEQENKKPHPF